MATRVAHNRTSVEDILAHPAVTALFANPGWTLSMAAEEFQPAAPGAKQSAFTPTLSRMISRLEEEGVTLPAHVRARRVRRRGKDSAADASVHTYPIYARVPGGAFNGSNQHDLDPIGEYPTDLSVRQYPEKPAPFAMIVTGHSMTNPNEVQQFPDGSRVLCDPGLMPDLGDFVVVVDSYDESLTLKKLVNRAPAPGRDLWLEPLNPDYSAFPFEDERHQLAGVVVDAVLPLYRKPSKTARNRR